MSSPDKLKRKRSNDANIETRQTHQRANTGKFDDPINVEDIGEEREIGLDMNPGLRVQVMFGDKLYWGTLIDIWVASNDVQTYRVKFDDNDMADYSEEDFNKIKSDLSLRNDECQYVCLQCDAEPCVYSLGELKRHTKEDHGGKYLFNKGNLNWEATLTQVTQLTKLFPEVKGKIKKNNSSTRGGQNFLKKIAPFLNPGNNLKLQPPLQGKKENKENKTGKKKKIAPICNLGKSLKSPVNKKRKKTGKKETSVSGYSGGGASSVNAKMKTKNLQAASRLKKKYLGAEVCKSFEGTLHAGIVVKVEPVEMEVEVKSVKSVKSAVVKVAAGGVNSVKMEESTVKEEVVACHILFGDGDEEDISLDEFHQISIKDDRGKLSFWCIDSKCAGCGPFTQDGRDQHNKRRHHGKMIDFEMNRHDTKFLKSNSTLIELESNLMSWTMLRKFHNDLNKLIFHHGNKASAAIDALKKLDWLCASWQASYLHRENSINLSFPEICKLAPHTWSPAKLSICRSLCTQTIYSLQIMEEEQQEQQTFSSSSSSSSSSSYSSSSSSSSSSLSLSTRCPVCLEDEKDVNDNGMFQCQACALSFHHECLSSSENVHSGSLCTLCKQTLLLCKSIRNYDINETCRLSHFCIASPFRWWDSDNQQTPLHVCAALEDSSLSCQLLNIMLFKYVIDGSNWDPTKTKKGSGVLRVGTAIMKEKILSKMLYVRDCRGMSSSEVAERHGNNTYRHQLALKAATEPQRIETFNDTWFETTQMRRLRPLLPSVTTSISAPRFGHDVTNAQEPVNISWINKFDEEQPPLHPDNYITTVVEHSSVTANWTTVLHVPSGGSGGSSSGGSSSGGSSSEFFDCKCDGSTPFDIGRESNPKEKYDTLAAKICCHSSGKKLYRACNHNCRCAAEHGHHMSRCQRGSSIYKGVTHRLQLFKTKNRGWAVRSLEFISKNSFVSEYVAEIVRSSENKTTPLSSSSSSSSSEEKLDYDFCEGKNLYVLKVDNHHSLDGARLSNISSRYNHQCRDSTLFLARVQCYHHDKDITRMCFFAQRDIQKNEELTFNYWMGMTNIKKKINEHFGPGGCGCQSCKVEINKKKKKEEKKKKKKKTKRKKEEKEEGEEEREGE